MSKRLNTKFFMLIWLACLVVLAGCGSSFDNAAVTGQSPTSNTGLNTGSVEVSIPLTGNPAKVLAQVSATAVNFRIEVLNLTAVAS